MKTKKTKQTKKQKKQELICGTLDDIQRTSRDLDPTMKVVWTTGGFFALPKS